MGSRNVMKKRWRNMQKEKSKSIYRLRRMLYQLGVKKHTPIDGDEVQDFMYRLIDKARRKGTLI